MRLPGDFRDEANGETGIRVSAAEGVNDEQAFAGELLSYQPFQVLPGFLGQRFVVVLAFAFVGPPERVTRGVVTDNVFILRRTIS